MQQAIWAKTNELKDKSTCVLCVPGLWHGGDGTTKTMEPGFILLVKVGDQGRSSESMDNLVIRLFFFCFNISPKYYLLADETWQD